MSTIFRWAIGESIVESSPCFALRKLTKEKSRDRVLTDDELRAVWKALDNEPSPVWKAFFKLIILTGVRKSETLNACWSDFDFTEGTWRIPTTKSDRPHLLPLSDAAVAVMTELKAFTGSETFLFPSSYGGAVMNPNRARDRVLERSETEHWTIHDLRRTLRTGITKLRFPEEVGDRILNNATAAGVRKVYQRHQYLPEMRQALNAWAHELTRIVANEPANAEVLPDPAGLNR